MNLFESKIKNALFELLKDNEIKSIKGKINENEKSISKLDEKIQKLDKKLSDFKGQYFLDKKITDLSSDIEDVDEDINKITAIKKDRFEQDFWKPANCHSLFQLNSLIQHRYPHLPLTCISATLYIDAMCS